MVSSRKMVSPRRLVRGLICHSRAASESERSVTQSTHSSKHSLVGGSNHLEKYEFVSWDHYSQYMEKSIEIH